jgi:hypothetical protein
MVGSSLQDSLNYKPVHEQGKGNRKGDEADNDMIKQAASSK